MGETLRDIVAGAVAGSAGIYVGYPLDSIKVRLQTQTQGVSGAGAGSVRPPSYSGILDALRSMLRESGGWRVLFRGVASPLLASVPVSAVTFGVQGAALRGIKQRRPDWSPAASHAVAGALSGLAQVPFSCPSELIKTQLQARPALVATYGSSTVVAASRILREYGSAGLARGLGLTLTRDTAAYAIYFSTYDVLKAYFARRAVREAREEDAGAGHSSSSSSSSSSPSPAPTSSSSSPTSAPAQHLSAGALMFCGGMAGVASWVFLHPIDVLKSLQQGLPLSTPRRDRTVAHIFASNLKASGPRFLLRGLLATSIRAFPASAITFPAFEWSVSLLDPIFRPGEARPEGIVAQHAAVAAAMRATHPAGEDGGPDEGGVAFDLELESVPGGAV
jgi:solute carrier family 25 (mitochondrial carnitine/acylcarnitine transporter), member 20/29